jgi:hypothetical protein
MLAIVVTAAVLKRGTVRREKQLVNILERLPLSAMSDVRIVKELHPENIETAENVLEDLKNGTELSLKQSLNW